MDSDNKYKVRQVRNEDMVVVAEMIQELADFERMPNAPQLSVQDLQHDGFQTQPPAFKCLVAESKNHVIGYALYFPIYSTWSGCSIMLKDLYVRADDRKHGVGRLLFNAVAKEAYLSGCTRVDFHVLRWNPARSFYESKGAVNLTDSEDWCYYRLAGDALRDAAETSKYLLWWEDPTPFAKFRWACPIDLDRPCRIPPLPPLPPLNNVLDPKYVTFEVSEVLGVFPSRWSQRKTCAGLKPASC